MPSTRVDNVSIAAESPVQCPNTCAASSMISELSDLEFVQSKYDNFRIFVRSLAPQEEKLLAWSTWLDKLPLSVFLAGGDGELRGVRKATTDEQRSVEAGLVLERFAMDWDFELSRIESADIIRLTRYLLLFATC